MKAEPVPYAASSSPAPLTLLLDLLLGAFVLNLVLQPLLEPDLGWHLRAGLDLIAQGWRLPETDPYSHTMPDWHWVEHAWLTDGLLALIYQALEPSGGLGLIVFFGGVTSLAWWIAARVASVHRTYRLVALVASLWVALPFLGARTQLISLLGVAVVLTIWNRMQRGQRQWLWALPPLFFLWANLHGGFTAGLFILTVLLSLSFLVKVCIEWKIIPAPRDEPVLSWDDLRRCALAFAVSIAVTCLNPYGWRLYVEIYESLTDRFMIDTLREWQPVSFQGWAGRAYGFYLLGLIGLMAGWYRRVEPVRWVLLALMVGLSLLHWRNVTLFLIVSLPLAAELCAAATESLLRCLPVLTRHASGAVFTLSIVAATALYALGTEHLEHVWQSGRTPEVYFERTEYPIEAVRWIRTHREETGTRLYNDYSYGGFLLWQLPGERIFIDGRMPAWRIKDRWIFHDYVDLNREDSPQLALLDRYGVDWAMVPRGSALAAALEAHPAWKPIYTDAKVVIVRRQP
ncbi:MAG TPA: hypothetical protein PKW52_09330 [Nitrospira sp.]|nr:hypothetical protein [Nitrospira sp.]HQV11530.1 hypothetical protein [Nitrospira sp.]